MNNIIIWQWQLSRGGQKVSCFDVSVLEAVISLSLPIFPDFDKGKISTVRWLGNSKMAGVAVNSSSGALLRLTCQRTHTDLCPQ